MSEKNIQQDRPAFHGSDIEQIEQYYKIPIFCGWYCL